MKKFLNEVVIGLVLLGLVNLPVYASTSEEKLKTTKNKPIIILDPAFGGKETGAIGEQALKEKDVVLDIALKIENLLSKRKNIKVYLTRSKDEIVSQKEREKYIQTHNPALVIRLRLNSSEGKDKWSADGFSANYDRKNMGSKRVAGIVLKNLEERILTPNKGMKPAKIYKDIQVPCIEIFLGYITNPNIEANLRDPNVRQVIAETICKSIIEYLDINRGE